MSSKIKSELAKLSGDEKERLQSLEDIVTAGLDNFKSVGTALMEINTSKLYRESHPTFEKYCKAKWGITPQHGRRLIAASEVAKNLEPIGSILPESESVARELTSLEPEEQREAWKEVVESTSGKKPTAKQVKAAAQKRKPKKKTIPKKSPSAQDVKLEVIQPSGQTRSEFVWLQFERWVDQMQAQFPHYYESWMDRQSLIDIITGHYPQENEKI